MRPHPSLLLGSQQTARSGDPCKQQLENLWSPVVLGRFWRWRNLGKKKYISEFWAIFVLTSLERKMLPNFEAAPQSKGLTGRQEKVMGLLMVGGSFCLKTFFCCQSGACLTPRDSQHTCDSDSLCGCLWKWGICSPGHWNAAKCHCCRDDKNCISSRAIPFSRRIGLGLYVQHTHSPAAWGFIFIFSLQGHCRATACSGDSDSDLPFNKLCLNKGKLLILGLIYLEKGEINHYLQILKSLWRRFSPTGPFYLN